MKKTLLTLAAAVATTMAGWAEINAPCDFSLDFSSPDATIEGWTTLGNDTKPTGDFKNYFQGYSSTNSYVVLKTSENNYWFSPCEFPNGTLSDEWLITPEITISSDSELIRFQACAFGTTNKSKYSVYVSEGGTNREDFTLLKDYTIIGQGDQFAKTYRRVPLKGYKDKKVRIAFVNHENKSGILGFRDFYVGPYYIGFTNPNLFDNFLVDKSSKDAKMSFSVKVTTPESCKGLTATLTTADGLTSTFTSNSSFTNSKDTNVRITFPDNLTGTTPFNISIKLNNDAYPETTISGNATFTEYIYDSHALFEDATGTWCGYCPLGMAVIDYHKALTPDKFHAVAIHSGDAMEAPDDIIGPMANASNLTGYPHAFLNRSAAGAPYELDVDGVLASKSPAEILFTNGHYTEKGTLKLSYRYRTAYSAPAPGLNLSFMVVENGIKGLDNRFWQQHTYIGAQLSSAQAAQILGDAYPYLALYENRQGGIVPVDDMVFNDVVRSVYPSYTGSPIKEEVTEGVFNTGTVEIPFPTLKITSAMMGGEPIVPINKDNLAVIAILTNSGTDEVMGVAEIKASEFKPEAAPIYLIGQPQGWDINSGAMALEAVGDKVYEGTFDIAAGEAMFRFYTALGDWGSNSIGSQVDDVPVDIVLNEGANILDAVNGKGSWNIPDWQGGRLTFSVDLNEMKVSIINLTSGIEDAATEAELYAEGKRIISSQATTFEVWTVSGSKIAETFGTEYDMTELASGMYIVRAAGKTIKVMR